MLCLAQISSYHLVFDQSSYTRDLSKLMTLKLKINIINRSILIKTSTLLKFDNQ